MAQDYEMSRAAVTDATPRGHVRRQLCPRPNGWGPPAKRNRHTILIESVKQQDRTQCCIDSREPTAKGESRIIALRLARPKCVDTRKAGGYASPKPMPQRIMWTNRTKPLGLLLAGGITDLQNPVKNILIKARARTSAFFSARDCGRDSPKLAPPFYRHDARRGARKDRVRFPALN